MKKNLKRVLTLLLAVVLMLGLCACGGGDDEADTPVVDEVVVTPTPVPLKVGDPNVYYARLDGTRYYAQPASEPDAVAGNYQGQMNKGTQVKKIAADGEWLQIALPTGINAWVHSWFLECDDEATDIARRQTMLTNRMNHKDFEPLDVQIYTCMANTLNCRSEPHTGGIVYCQISFGEELTVYGKNSGYYLCEMADGNIVYCSDDYLDKQATYVELAGTKDLRVLMPGADFNLKLTTKDNVAGRALYPEVPLLEESTAAMLMEAYEIFRTAGFTLKVYDAYRPASAQQTLSNAVVKAGGVAPTRCAEGHQTGTAVDVSLVNYASGKELTMPTKVFEFTQTAYRSSASEWTGNAKINAEYLTQVMTSVGFEAVDGEWWHFTNPNPTGAMENELNYDALNYIPVSQYGQAPATTTETGEGQ